MRFDPAHRRSWRWLAAAVLVVANFFLHKPISDLCDGLYARIGRSAYEWSMLLGISGLSTAGGLLLLRDGAPGLRRPATLASLGALAGLTVWVQQVLLVSNVELIHLPQFGLLAALLLAAGLPPQLAWLAATAGGALDEGYQRLVIYAATPNVYFDWNDIVLNTIGAAWAVLLACGGRGDTAAAGERRAQRLLLAALGAGLLLAWWLAPPRVVAHGSFPYLAPQLGRALTGRDYHVMSAAEGVLALLLVWGLVRLGVGTRLRHSAALAVLLACLFGCAAQPRVVVAPPLRAAAAPPFFITFWCGPPLAELTDARAEEIAAAGFDVIGAPCEGFNSPQLNHRALAVAARHGLRMFVTDPRVDQYNPAPRDWRQQVSAAVADYGGSPALAGYFLVDEPSADRFASLGEVTAQLRQLDPSRIAYINLLPDYVPADALGAPSYRDYVERYMRTVQPALLSVDYYPFKETADRDSFFANVSLMREQALAAGVPWLLIVQAMPHGTYRDPNEAELAWQVFNGLAYGARAISYFTYWTPVDVADAAHWKFRRGLVEHGRATDKLDQVRRINQTAHAIAGALDGYTSVAVVDSTRDAAHRAPPAAAPVAGIIGAVTLGVFAAPDGGRAALVVNQDYRGPQRVQLELRDALATQRFDPARQVWDLEFGRQVALELPPGGAALLAWTAPASEHAT